MARHFYLVRSNKEELKWIEKKKVKYLYGHHLMYWKIRNLEDEEIDLLQNKNNHVSINKRKFTLFEKIHWTFIFALYLLVLLVVLLFFEENNAGIFLGFLSVGTALFFSDGYKRLINIIKNRNPEETSKKLDFIANILNLPIVSFGFTLLFAFCAINFSLFIKKSNFNIPIISINNIGDILTWCGLIIFALDKTFMYIKNPYSI